MSPQPVAASRVLPDRALETEVALADSVRRRLQDHGIVPLPPDARIAPLLLRGEDLVAVRRGVTIERRREPRCPSGGPQGDLYLTTRRLIHLGDDTLAYPLDDILEAIAGNGVLRLLVDGRRGVDLCMEDPMALRVELGAVRAALRLHGRPPFIDGPDQPSSR